MAAACALPQSPGHSSVLLRVAYDRGRHSFAARWNLVRSLSVRLFVVGVVVVLSRVYLAVS